MSLIDTIRHALGITAPPVVQEFRALPPSTVDPTLHAFLMDDRADEMPIGGKAGVAPDDVVAKEFDWQHYQAGGGGGAQGAFKGEFNITPTVTTLETLYGTESVINIGINAIMRQFMQTKMYVGRTNPATGEIQKNYAHPLVRLIANPGTESSSAFVGNTAGVAMPLTGNAFWFISPGNQRLKRILASRVQLKYGKDGALVGYHVRPAGSEDGEDRNIIEVPYDRMVHLKRPNLYTTRVGLSLLVAAAQPVLTDKYMYEYVLGIFLRGGTTAGVIETKGMDVKQIARLMKSIQSIIGTRRNMHADKILPEDATWKASAKGPNDLQFIEIMKTNARRVMGHLKVPPFEFGDTDSVNRANADAQMEQFWTSCILPEQVNFCDSVKASPLAALFGLADDEFLAFDNSHVPFLDPLMRLLEADAKLAPVLTVNERRARIGWKALSGEYDKLAVEIKPGAGPGVLTLSAAAPVTATNDPLPALPPASEVGDGKENPTEASVGDALAAFKAEADRLNDEPTTIVSLMVEELHTCADICAKHPTDRAAAKKAIAERADAFAEKWSLATTPSVMRAYDQQLARLNPAKSLRRSCAKHGPVFVRKETEQDRRAKLDALRKRAEDFLRGKIREDQKGSFLGYTDTLTERAYGIIDAAIADGGSIDEAASRLRQEFGEAYEGQALTIVRTEYLSGISTAVDRFTRDLATVAARTRKTWIHSGGAGQPREEHLALDGVELEGKADAVPDLEFASGLRYPRDPRADAAETINCRCVLVNEVSDWGDEEE